MTGLEIEVISEYIPEAARHRIMELLEKDHLQLKIKKERKTRHGDYRMLPNGQHQITVNSNLNKYKFLITLIHEIAHLKAYKEYGRQIRPHGKEWKYTFKKLMLPFINPEVFPVDLLTHVAHHFKNPKASSDTDTSLALALKKYNPESDKIYVMDVERGQLFTLYNGKVFKRGIQRRKRIECLELSSGRTYLFNPLAEVDLIQ